MFEVAPQLRGIGALGQQVELIEDDLLVVIDDLARPQSAAYRKVLFDQAGDPLQQLDVLDYGLFNAGSNDLDDNFFAAEQASAMHLRDRSGGQWLEREFAENFLPGSAECLLDQAGNTRTAEAGNVVLKGLQLIGEFWW